MRERDLLLTTLIIFGTLEYFHTSLTSHYVSSLFYSFCISKIINCHDNTCCFLLTYACCMYCCLNTAQLGNNCLFHFAITLTRLRNILCKIDLAIVLYGSVLQHRILHFIFQHGERSADNTTKIFRFFKRSGCANMTSRFLDKRTKLAFLIIIRGSQNHFKPLLTHQNQEKQNILI